MNKWSVKELVTDIIYDIVGCLALSISVQCFSAPNNLAPGGISGVAILINYLTGLPISALSFALNIPLLLLAWFYLGRLFTLRTIKTVLIMTVLLEVCSYFPVYQGNIILTALCGGALQGIGVGLVFMRASTTGGTDIAMRLIQLKFPHMPMGQIMIIMDGVILAVSAIVYRNVESALVAMLFIFVAGRVLDSLLYGLDTGKVMMIISEQHAAIASRVHEELDRGCTVLEGRGSYTDTDRPVLLIAVRRQQYVAVKRIVWSLDDRAFMFALDASEILGEGFREDKAER